MKNNQVKITFQDDEQTAVVQITQNGNEVSVSTKFTRNSIWPARPILLL